MYSAAVDNQLKLCTGRGLLYFQQPGRVQDRQDFSTWPLASVSPDLGSDQLAASNFWQNSLNLNLDLFPDPGHGAWNDVKLAIKSTKNWVMLNMIMIAFNCQHGPFNEDARQGQISGCVQQFCRTTEHADQSPLFESFVPRMLHAQGAPEDLGDPKAADRMLQVFKDENPFRVKGSKVNYNRFMGAIKKGSDVAPEWPFRAFGFLHTVLECGLVTKAKVDKLDIGTCVPMSSTGEGATRSTADVRASAIEKMSSWKSENQLVIAALAMSDEVVEKRHRAMLKVFRPWLDWHQRQAAELRSVEASVDWLSAQARSEFLATCANTVAVLSAPADLRWVGLVMPTKRAQDFNPVMLEMEHSLAQCLAHLALSIVGLRLQRCMHQLRGWSARSVLFLSNDATEVKQELARSLEARGHSMVLPTTVPHTIRVSALSFGHGTRIVDGFIRLQSTWGGGVVARMASCFHGQGFMPMCMPLSSLASMSAIRVSRRRCMSGLSSGLCRCNKSLGR